MAIYQFGRCTLDGNNHRLLVSGIQRHIEPQVFDLLLFLVERSGEVVSQDALVQSVWKSRVISDSAISVRISAARKAVGDDGSRQAIIKTIPRRGFSLIAEVTRLDEAEESGQSVSKTLAVEPTARPVVGVFPFETQSDDLAPYLVRGIAEDIATELSRFAEITVIAPYSTFRHDFRKRDHFQVAQELGISHIVSGSLSGSQSLERVTVRLMSTENGSSLWSERYDVQEDEYFEVQDDLVGKIVATLTHGLKVHLMTSARSKPPASLSAYESLLRGLYVYKWGIGSMDEAEQARFWFDRAIELDPEYGRPRAWRECVNTYWWSSPPAESDLSEAISRINMAIASDQNDHEVNRIKGALHMINKEYELADYHLSKAVEVNPNDAHILITMGAYRSYLAENTDDLTYVDLAFKRNPFHPSWYWQHRAVVLFAHGRYDEVVSNLQRSTDETEVAHLYLAAAYAHLGRINDAKQQIEQLHQLNSSANIDWLNVAYPTRCYQESEHRTNFIDGLRKSGLK